MDYLAIFSAIILPVAGWCLGRLSALERADSRFAVAIENLDKTASGIWSEIIELRKTVNSHNARIATIEALRHE